MDHIISPKTVHQPALITPRAPHYNEKERKQPPEQRQHHDDEEGSEDQDSTGSVQPDADNPIGTKLDIQI